MADWSQSAPSVYASMAPAYQELPREQVEQVVESVFGPGTTLAMAEGFFDDVGHALSSVGRSVGSVASKAAPGVLSGAMAGAPLGPWGMLAGGLLGGVGSALTSSGGAAPARTAPGGGSGATGAAAGLPVIPAMGAGTGSTGAIAQLLSALGSPTVRTALTSMLMGPAGRRTAPAVTGQQVPVGAIANLLGMLAARASAEWEASTPYLGEDYLDAYVEPSFDTADPEARSAWLYAQLLPPEAGSPADTGRASTGSGSTVGAPSSDEAWLDDMYDEIEAQFYRA